MNEMKNIVVGETTEIIIRTLFDSRIAQESNENAYNTVDRALKIRDLKSQMLGFIKRNPNAIFKITAPEFKSDKNIRLTFSNFDHYLSDEEDLNLSLYKIDIQDNFIEANIIQEVKVGKDIMLKIKA